MSAGREQRPPPGSKGKQGQDGGKETRPPPPPTPPEPPDEPHHGGSGDYLYEFTSEKNWEEYEWNYMTTGFPPLKDPTPKPDHELPKPEKNDGRKTTTKKPYNGSKSTSQPPKQSDKNQNGDPPPEPDQAAQTQTIPQGALIAIITGLVILGIILGIAVYLYCRRKSKSKKSHKEPMSHGSYKKTEHHLKTDYPPRTTARTENPYVSGNYYSSIQSDKMDPSYNYPALSKGIDNPDYNTTYLPPLQTNARGSSTRPPIRSNNTVSPPSVLSEEPDDVYLSIADSALDSEPPPKTKHEYLEMTN